MSKEGVRSIAVVCEAAADRQTACELADRVLLQCLGRPDTEALGHLRTWRGWRRSDAFLAWKDVKTIARQNGIRPPHGHFAGEPGEPDAAAGRRALWVLRAASTPPDAILLIRDSDNDLSRHDGLCQARNGTGWTAPIVIGVAHTCRECWVLNGFDPKDAPEQEKLRSQIKRLGFNPVEKADRLAAKRANADQNPKHVLKTLTDASPARERECWTRTPIDSLKKRGESTRLHAFLEEIEARLGPLFTPKSYAE